MSYQQAKRRYERDAAVQRLKGLSESIKDGAAAQPPVERARELVRRTEAGEIVLTMAQREWARAVLARAPQEQG